MAGQPKFAPRIHVLLAKEAPYGVVIRRGPSKQVCTIGWNREEDTFQIGQWLKGRIYERRSDLSPDGKLMIYFAMNGAWTSESKGSWSAISRAPYLKAVGFWPQGNCWFGGGLFVDNDTYWLNGRYVPEPLTKPPLKLSAGLSNFQDYGGECPGVYYLRLLRDGWTLVYKKSISKQHQITVFEKPNNDVWILRKFANSQMDAPEGRGCYNDTHELENIKTGEKIDGLAWEWAEVDGKRIVWAQDGKLFAARLWPKDMGDISMLHDFNQMTFEPIPAPY